MSDSNSEQWRPVVSYEGSYEVSSMGRVRSVDRLVADTSGRTRLFRGRLRRLQVSLADGYQRVTLSHPDRKPVCVTVHKLVAEAFLGVRPPGQQCRHLDGNQLNCAVTNLRWGTGSENQRDQVRHGTHLNSSRAVCIRGHRLAIPNLVGAAARTGQRGCLACHRARVAIRYAKQAGKQTSTIDEVANTKYQEILDMFGPIGSESAPDQYH